jgi:hypothetical protein
MGDVVGCLKHDAKFFSTPDITLRRVADCSSLAHSQNCEASSRSPATHN